MVKADVLSVHSIIVCSHRSRGIDEARSSLLHSAFFVVQHFVSSAVLTEMNASPSTGKNQIRPPMSTVRRDLDQRSVDDYGTCRDKLSFRSCLLEMTVILKKQPCQLDSVPTSWAQWTNVRPNTSMVFVNY